MKIMIWLYSLVSVFLVSLAAFAGVFSLSFKKEFLKKIIIYLVSFSAGALLGDVFIHLLPELAEEGLSLQTSLLVLGGIFLSFITEKIICWHHCHLPMTKNHVHSFAYINLIGDGLHNFIDGLAVAVSYLVSIPTGIATTIAVILHEIPQEIGDFGVLVHGGFERKKALFFNFLTGTLAILGAVLGLFFSQKIEGLETILLPIAAGNFIYIASTDLIPELHKETALKKALLQTLFFLLGIGIMGLMLLME